MIEPWIDYWIKRTAEIDDRLCKARSMAEIKIVSDDSVLLVEVIQLWRDNRKTLGPYPKGAFLERAQKGEIFAAIENGKVLGYLLFYSSSKFDRVRLTHLCVGSENLGRGLAHQLIEELRRRTVSKKGIGLHCRRDYAAWNLWPKLGFVPISEKVGRSKEGHVLTYFWLQHPHPTLFTTSHDDERVKVVIDTNIFLDLDDPDRSGADETAGMAADWLQPLIQICISEELYTEIYRNEDAVQRKDRLSMAGEYEQLVSNTDDFLLANRSVRSILWVPVSERDKSDQRHLARAIASDATAFVTRDAQILKVADEVYDQHGLSIVRPSQLISQFEELRHESEYQRARLAGSPIQFRRVSNGASDLARHFSLQTGQDRQRVLVEQLNRTFANPDDFECHLIESGDEKPVAVHVIAKANPNVLTVPVFRIAKNVLNTRLAPTLARTLLVGIVQRALKSGTHAVLITESCLSPVVTTALQLTGFFKAGDNWLKLSVVGANTIEETSLRLESITQSAEVVCDEVHRIKKLMCDTTFADDVGAVLDMERNIWPGKIIGCNIPNYVIAIRPRWASDLFDIDLARNSLWGSETELALNPDSVYYRSTRPPLRVSKGRILWYVSDDNEFPGVKSIRACSQMRDVVTGRPKELFRQFRRLGVYQWNNVLETAGSIDGQLMAIQFCDTELFGSTIGWDSAQMILRKHGIRSTFVSPTEITEDAFLEIYRIGMDLDH